MVEGVRLCEGVVDMMVDVKVECMLVLIDAAVGF